MKKLITFVLAWSLAIMPSLAQASAPTYTGSDAAGSLTADSTSITPTTPQGTWNGTGPIFSYLYVCLSSISEEATLTTDNSSKPENNNDCLKASSSNGTHASVTSGTSLSFDNLWIENGSAWEKFDVDSHGAHMVLENRFIDIDGVLFTNSASVEVTPVTPSEPVMTVTPLLSIAGDVITSRNAAPTAADGGEWYAIPTIWVCQDTSPTGILFDQFVGANTPQLFSDAECRIALKDATGYEIATSISSAIVLTPGQPDSKVKYDPEQHGENFFLMVGTDFDALPPGTDQTFYVVAGTTQPGQDSSSRQTGRPFSAPAPFEGPVITAPSIASSAAPGSTITIPGENLDSVSAVSIGSTDAEVEVIDDQLQVVVPESLEAGTYDPVISSSTGNVTISDAITVSGVAVSASEAPRGSTTRDDDEVKIRVFNPAGAGKVQIIVNGEEIAWVRTDDPNDPKLTNGYLVRTVELVPGKNVIEILVDGERIRRNAYGL